MAGRRRWFASGRNRGWGRAATALALTAAFSVTAPLGVAQGVTGYHFKGTVWNPRPLPSLPVVRGHALTDATATSLTKGGHGLRRYQAKAPAWPAAGATTVVLTAPAATATGAGSSASPPHRRRRRLPLPPPNGPRPQGTRATPCRSPGP
ncbi:hypothetical protein ACFQZC_03260 [Streptacidiphilus monticola]